MFLRIIQDLIKKRKRKNNICQVKNLNLYLIQLIFIQIEH